MTTVPNKYTCADCGEQARGTPAYCKWCGLPTHGSVMDCPTWAYGDKEGLFMVLCCRMGNAILCVECGEGAE